jgi:hypothetical protein
MINAIDNAFATLHRAAYRGALWVAVLWNSFWLMWHSQTQDARARKGFGPCDFTAECLRDHRARHSEARLMLACVPRVRS